MDTLHKPWETRVAALAETGLTLTGRIFVEQFMLAQQQNRGHNNRKVLIRRLRKATDEQRTAALSVFDDFCRAKGV